MAFFSGENNGYVFEIQVIKETAYFYASSKYEKNFFLFLIKLMTIQNCKWVFFFCVCVH